MEKEPKETKIENIIKLISLMTPEDQFRAMSDLFMNERIIIHKTYDPLGNLVKVAYEPPEYVQFYPE